MIIQVDVNTMPVLEKALIDFISKCGDNKMSLAVSSPMGFELYQQYEKYETNAKTLLRQVNSINNEATIQPA
jgi:hypothetical protein